VNSTIPSTNKKPKSRNSYENVWESAFESFGHIFDSVKNFIKSMKMYAILFLSALCICFTSAFVCPDNYCAKKTCDVPSCGENELLVPKSTFCGCCSSCITQLNEGDGCLELMGSPSKAQCRDPLKCVDGKCTRA
ncbi:hypothetical protein C0J52_28057, partial [Blattella germanica]